MTPSDSSSSGGPAWEVRTPLQARLLTDATSRAYFMPFLARTRSVAQAAGELGCALDAMYYRVRRFLAAGLLEVVGQRRRAGRPIKLYRSVADAFYIPFALTPFTEIEERVRHDVAAEDEAVVAALARALRDYGLEGRRLYRLPDGEDMMESAADAGEAREWRQVVRSWPAHRPVAERTSSELDLTDAEARELLLALFALQDRYRRDRAGKGRRRRYHLQFALVPWER